MVSFYQENTGLLEQAVQEEKTLSIYNLIVDGGLGGQIIIAILFVLLALALYIYFERFFAIKSASKVDKNFMNQIKDYVSNGKLESANALCKSTDTPTARLIGKGISRIGKPLDDINTAIETAGKLEVYQLEKNVSV
ncbi:MAG: biopolymer transport protein ExbB, partial [Maribacter sp.]